MSGSDRDEARHLEEAAGATVAVADDATRQIADRLRLDAAASDALNDLIRGAVQPDAERELVDTTLDDWLGGPLSRDGKLFTIPTPKFSEGPLVVKIDLAKVRALLGAALKGDVGTLAKSVAGGLKDAYERAIVGPETFVRVVLRWIGAQDFTIAEAQLLYELCVSVDHDRTLRLPLDALLANVNGSREGVGQPPLDRPAFDAALRVLEALRFVAIDTARAQIRLAQVVIPWRSPFDRLEPG
jgi:hypothetical protein